MKVLLFDIDGTLIDAGGTGQAAMEKAIAEVFGKSSPVDGIPTAGRTDRAIAADLFRFMASKSMITLRSVYTGASIGFCHTPCELAPAAFCRAS